MQKYMYLRSQDERSNSVQNYYLMIEVNGTCNGYTVHPIANQYVDYHDTPWKTPLGTVKVRMLT